MRFHVEFTLRRTRERERERNKREAAYFAFQVAKALTFISTKEKKIRSQMNLRVGQMRMQWNKADEGEREVYK